MYPEITAGAKEVHQFCKKIYPQLDLLIQQFRDGKWPPMPQTYAYLHNLMMVQTEINNSMSTLKYVQEHVFGETFASALAAASNLTSGGAQDKATDFGYFGPTPDVTGGAAFVADITLAVTAAVKQHFAIQKEIRHYQQNPAELHSDIRHSYEALVQTVWSMVMPCAGSPLAAMKYNKAGLILLILVEVWGRVKKFAWCAGI
jgi:hypothetical protein